MFRRSTPLAACIWVLLAGIAATPDARHAGGPPSVGSGARASHSAAPVPAFRLGTAGRPFAWSTAIGDLNADGRPDVVVADRVSPRSQATAYRLDFSVAGEVPASDTFQSLEDGVRIRLADVDDDADLDVVLASATSGRTIGVWLNDGAGHFTRSTARLPPSVAPTPGTLDRGLPAAAVFAADAPSRRAAALPPARTGAPALAPGAASPAVDTEPARRRLASSAAAPRAPPAAPIAVVP